MRRYLERLLKQAALNLQVKVDFRYNDDNEDRMCHELLTELKSKVNKHAAQELKNDPTIGRLLSSTFIGSKSSHNGSFKPKIGDLKAFWQDIRELEDALRCDQKSCKHSFVSLKYYDNVKKAVSCGCGNRSYGWRK